MRQIKGSVGVYSFLGVASYTTGVKKKSHHNFIRVVIFRRVTREGRKWVVGTYVI